MSGLQAVAGAIPVNVVMLENGENSTLDFVQLKTVLDKHDPNTFVILVMHPQQAHDAFEALNVQVCFFKPPLMTSICIILRELFLFPTSQEAVAIGIKLHDFMYEILAIPHQTVLSFI